LEARYFIYAILQKNNDAAFVDSRTEYLNDGMFVLIQMLPYGHIPFVELSVIFNLVEDYNL